MTEPNDNAISTTSEYYDSKDADMFYYEVWGGEDIHIGLYRSEDESIFEASARTKQMMASFLGNFGQDSKVLDIGAGFGGTARFLAKTYGCKVTALNLSEVQNDRHRQMNAELRLDDLIEVVDGNFEDIPFQEAAFDIVWSQDAILHSGDRDRVIAEVSRVLKGMGDFIFTDPMQSDSCREDVLQPILDRLHLNSLASPDFYREAARRYDLKEVRFKDLTSDLVTHYTRVLRETVHRENELDGLITPLYLENMKKGLDYWIDGGKKGYLTWGIFHFRKTD
jgi:sarcosine/dimethylglycine N-methyltransferase